MTIASILSDFWRGAPQAQELQKSPGGIGLKDLLRKDDV